MIAEDHLRGQESMLVHRVKSIHVESEIAQSSQASSIHLREEEDKRWISFTKGFPLLDLSNDPATFELQVTVAQLFIVVSG